MVYEIAFSHGGNGEGYRIVGFHGINFTSLIVGQSILS